MTTTITDNNMLKRQITTTIADDDEIMIDNGKETKILSLHKLEEVHNKLKAPQVNTNNTQIDFNGMEIDASTSQEDRLVDGAEDIDPETLMNKVALNDMILTVIKQKKYLID